MIGATDDCCHPILDEGNKVSYIANYTLETNMTAALNNSISITMNINCDLSKPPQKRQVEKCRTLNQR